MSCEYCHEDRDGYIRPLDNNAHAYLQYPDKLILRFGKERRECKIKHCPMCGRELSKGEKTMDMNFIDRAARQMLSNQLIIMGALDDLIMHGGGNQWAIVHPAVTALHDGMAATSDILAQSVEPPKEDKT